MRIIPFIIIASLSTSLISADLSIEQQNIVPVQNIDTSDHISTNTEQSNAAEQPELPKEEQPKYIGKASSRNRKQRSRHVLDVVLAGIVAVGTLVAILVL